MKVKGNVCLNITSAKSHQQQLISQRISLKKKQNLRKVVKSVTQRINRRHQKKKADFGT